MPGLAGKAVLAKPAASGGSSGIPPAQVQKKSASGSSTAPAATFDSTPTAGKILIAVVGTQAVNSLAQITNPGGGWATFPGGEVRAGSTSAVRAIWKESDGTEGTVTFALANSTNWGVQLFEYSNLHSSPVDQVDTSTDGSVTSLALGATPSTSVADELVVAAVMINGTSGGSEALTDSFTLENVSNSRLIVGTKVLSAVGTPSTTVSWTTARTPAGVLCTFKAV